MCGWTANESLTKIAVDTILIIFTVAMPLHRLGLLVNNATTLTTSVVDCMYSVGAVAALPTIYRIAGYFRGVYISRISRKHSQSSKIKILKDN